MSGATYLLYEVYRCTVCDAKNMDVPKQLSKHELVAYVFTNYQNKNVQTKRIDCTSCGNEQKQILDYILMPSGNSSLRSI